MTDNSSPSNQPVLPKLKELRISNEEALEWTQQPATRLFFKSLGLRYKNLQKSAMTVYNRENVNETACRVAEIYGGMIILLDLMNSAHGDKEHQLNLFSQEDLEEVGVFDE